MLHTLQTGVARVPAGALAELRAHGVADDDIAAAYTLQEQQRACGVTVLPLAVICGLKPFQPGFKSSLSRTASRPSAASATTVCPASSNRLFRPRRTML